VPITVANPVRGSFWWGCRFSQRRLPCSKKRPVFSLENYGTGISYSTDVRTSGSWYDVGAHAFFLHMILKKWCSAVALYRTFVAASPCAVTHTIGHHHHLQFGRGLDFHPKNLQDPKNDSDPDRFWYWRSIKTGREKGQNPVKKLDAMWRAFWQAEKILKLNHLTGRLGKNLSRACVLRSNLLYCIGDPQRKFPGIANDFQSRAKSHLHGARNLLRAKKWTRTLLNLLLHPGKHHDRNSEDFHIVLWTANKTFRSTISTARHAASSTGWQAAIRPIFSSMRATGTFFCSDLAQWVWLTRLG